MLLIHLKHISQKFLVVFTLLFLCACDKTPDNAGKPGEKSAKSIPGNVSTAVEGPAIDWPSNIEPTHVAMQLVKVSEHAYFVQGPAGTPTDNDGFMSNAGVVVTSDGVVVFDALGTPSLAYKLYSLIRNVTDQPVKKVVVSHYHADHIYGLQVFKELGAEIIAPQGAKDYLASDAKQGRLNERRESLFPWVNEDTYIVEPDVYIDKDASFDLGGVTFDLILLGSTHSQGDLMLRVKPDGVLYSGDLVFEGRIPFVAGSNPDVWLKRLTELDTRTIRTIVPGHGSMSENPELALKFTRDYLSYMHNAMKDAVENLMTFDEAYADMDWSSYEKLPAFQVNRINAYYVYLKLEALSVE